MANLLSNNCTKNYRNHTTTVKIIAEGGVVYYSATQRAMSTCPQVYRMAMGRCTMCHSLPVGSCTAWRASAVPVSAAPAVCTSPSRHTTWYHMAGVLCSTTYQWTGEKSHLLAGDRVYMWVGVLHGSHLLLLSSPHITWQVYCATQPISGQVKSHTCWQVTECTCG